MSVPRSMLRIIYNRTTIRKFKPTEVPDEIIDMIIEAGQRAPSFNQAYTFIAVTEREKRRRIEEVCGVSYVSTAPVIIVVCADLHRPAKALDYLGHEHALKHDEHPVETVYSFLETGMAIQNMIIAAEVLGYGTAIVDCALWEAEAVASILELPKGVVPVAMLCLGEKDERPPLRPRWPIHIVFHRNKYREPNPYEVANYMEESFEKYDGENYIMKYAGVHMRYKDYLIMRTERTKEVVKKYERLNKFLRKVGFKLG